MCKRNMDRFPLVHPQLGTWPATQACILTGNQTGNLSACGVTPNPLSHTGQGVLSLFTRVEAPSASAFCLTQICQSQVPGCHLYFRPLSYKLGVSITPSQGCHLARWLLDFRETLTYIYWFIIKDIIKDAGEQPYEEVHGTGYRRALSIEASVPVGLGCTTSQHADVFINPEAPCPSYFRHFYGGFIM